MSYFRAISLTIQQEIIEIPSILPTVTDNLSRKIADMSSLMKQIEKLRKWPLKSRCSQEIFTQRDSYM